MPTLSDQPILLEYRMYIHMVSWGSLPCLGTCAVLRGLPCPHLSPYAPRHSRPRYLRVEPLSRGAVSARLPCVSRWLRVSRWLCVSRLPCVSRWLRGSASRVCALCRRRPLRLRRGSAQRQPAAAQRSQRGN